MSRQLTPAERALARAAAQHLQEKHPELELTGVTLHATLRGHAVTVAALDPGGWSYAAIVGTGSPHPVPPTLGDLVYDVVAKAEKPLKGDAIAGRLGRRNDGNLRGAISKLMREGRIRRVDRGYCLPVAKVAA